MDIVRKSMYTFFDLPFHKRIEIAKNLQIFEDLDLEMLPTEATQKWCKQIVNDKLIDQWILMVIKTNK